MHHPRGTDTSIQPLLVCRSEISGDKERLLKIFVFLPSSFCRCYMNSKQTQYILEDFVDPRGAISYFHKYLKFLKLSCVVVYTTHGDMCHVVCCLLSTLRWIQFIFQSDTIIYRLPAGGFSTVTCCSSKSPQVGARAT